MPMIFYARRDWRHEGLFAFAGILPALKDGVCRTF